MSGIFLILFLVSLVAFIYALIKPQKVNLLIKKDFTRKKFGIILGSMSVFFFVLIGVAAPPVEQEEESAIPENNGVVVATVTPSISLITQEISTQESPIPSPAETQKPLQLSSTPSQKESFYSVTKIIDGDTIEINMSGKAETLRLIGMDTPETVDPRKPVQCFGVEASNKAKELLSGKKVKIESDSSQDTRDKYERLLVYVYRDDGLFYNKYMIEQGYAHEYTYEVPYKYQVEFKAAQKSAQDNQRGLWSPTTCNGNTTTNTTPSAQPSSLQTGSKYYTSSHFSSKYWYPETCDEWKSLSPSYLKSFSSLEELLAKYPSKTKSPQCN